MTRLLALFTFVCVLALSAAPAFADAPDPIPSATHGSLVVNADGSRTLTVQGGTNDTTDPGWRWTTHHSDCNTDRSGAGVAMVWNDPTQPGNPVTGAGALGTFLLGTPTDNVVHPTPGAVVQDIAAPSDYLNWRGGCGTYQPVLGYNTGTWGPFSHTYPASVKGAISVCPLMYDVHGKTSGTAPNGIKEVTAGGNNHNGDNSLESNGGTPQGNGCFSTTFATPHLSIVKQVSKDGGATWAKSVTVLAGDSVQYRFTITNDGDAGTDLTGVHVNELTGITDCDNSLHAVSPAGFAGNLASGASAAFVCDHTMGNTDLHNTARAEGSYTPAGGQSQPVISAPDSADVHVIKRGVSIVLTKDANQDHAYDGDKISFTISAKNTGQDSLSNVSLVDAVKGTNHGCESVTGPTGDDGDNVFEPGETWKYVCTMTVVHAEENAAHQIVNIAHVEGDTVIGGDHVSSNEDDALVPILHPAIAIDKTGPATGQAGDKISYVLTVTNPGDDPFADSKVIVSDQQCNGDPVTLIGKGGDASPASLDPGDAWTYSCSVQTAVGDTAVHNVAKVDGCDGFGKCASDDDDADTTLTQPNQLVLPERVTPGAAKLAAPTGCTANAFNARVRGSKIATVTFVLDGKVIKRFRKPLKSGSYSVRVNPAQLRIGVHRLVANVTFQSASRTKPMTIRRSFQRCTKKLSVPRFTG